MRGYASVRAHVSYDFVMQKVVKGGILEFIRSSGTKKWIVLCE